jgi:hypothetical protein
MDLSLALTNIFFLDLVKRVHELNERVEDIQIEQNAQRVSGNL